MLKPRNGGEWTEARFHSFVVSGLRSKHQRWGPKHAAKARARVDRGKYLCAGCGTIGPATLPPKPGNKKRRDNAAVDHIEPVVDPAIGFEGWDRYVERMFVEVEGYQVLCWECHEAKTAVERAVSVERKRRERGA